MLTRFRRRLTYANVMVTILAFIVLGGGTAMAAFVVSSNSQIGPGTISGHSPPSGKHANIVDNSITGADVKESTLARVPSAANGARRINFNHANTMDVNSPVPVLHLDELTLKAACTNQGGAGGETDLGVWVTSTKAASFSGGLIAYDSGNSQTRPGDFGDTVSANSMTQAFEIATALTYQDQAEGDLVYHNANRTIALTLHARADAAENDCQLYGVAVPAPG